MPFGDFLKKTQKKHEHSHAIDNIIHFSTFLIPSVSLVDEKSTGFWIPLMVEIPKKFETICWSNFFGIEISFHILVLKFH